MRTISADLTAVQAVRSPRASVSCTVEARGTGPNMPAVVWSQLIPNTGQVSYKRTTAASRSAGGILKFVAEAASVVQHTVTTPTTAAGWTGAATATVLAHAVLSLCALRNPVTDAIRLWYIHTNGNIYYITSTNDGSTWDSPTTVYTGGDATHDLVVSYVNNSTTVGAPWIIMFSCYNAGTGQYTPKCGYVLTGVWTFQTYGTAGWRAAGVDAYGAEQSARRVLVYRQEDLGASRLRVMDQAASSWNNPTDIDQTQAGLFGIHMSFFRFCQLPESGVMAAVAGEHADGRGGHLGICSLFYGSECLVDETIILPDIVMSADEAYACLTEDAATGNLYLVGDTVVYQGAKQAATSTTLTPISYTYADGQFELTFEQDIATLYVGQILVINRTLTWNTQTGTETVRAYIARVEKHTDKVVVIAYDPLGFLGVARCRRPSILNDGTAAGMAHVMRLLCARFGLKVTADDSAQETAAVMPMTLAPNESLAGAAYRVTSQSKAWLVPRNDGTFELTLITPPDSDVSGKYADTAQTYGSSEQPIIAAAEYTDYRRLTFSYILGTYGTDPEDGAALAMAAGPVVGNTRPLSYSLTNTRYNTYTRVEQAATAEADRQAKLTIDGMIETWANLALELHDIVQVTDSRLGWTAKQFRVRRIVERWDRGRLTQTVYLGTET